MEIIVTRTTGVKCPRCWHYHYLQETPDRLCDRCMGTLMSIKDDFSESFIQLKVDIDAYYQAERIKYTVVQT